MWERRIGTPVEVGWVRKEQNERTGRLESRRDEGARRQHIAPHSAAALFPDHAPPPCPFDEDVKNDLSQTDIHTSAAESPTVHEP
jgi:hypothetical protein